MRILSLTVMLSFLVMLSQASATLTVSVSQFGADSGSVMKGVPFTVTVSGLTGSGSVTLTTLQNSSVFSASENSTKTYSEGTTSVSWTTVTANEKLSAQTISAVSAVPYSDSGTSSAFDIKLPPSIITSVTPSSYLDPTGSQTIQMTIQNWGETTAQSVAVNFSLPAHVSLDSGSSTQTISSIAGGEGGSGESVGLSWTVGFSSGLADSSITIITSPSNADSATDTITISVTEAGGQTPGNTGGTGGTGGAGGPSEKKENRRPALVPGVGIRNNLHLQAAIEKVLAKGKMDLNAFENLIRLSQSISSNISLARSIRAFNGTTTLTSSFTHSGKERIRNFMIYEKVPKTFASNAANITVTAIGVSGSQTVETDPEYIFSYSELSPGQVVNITYSVRKEVNTSLIDQFQTEVYAEEILSQQGPGTPEGPTGPSLVRICNPGERRCAGMNLQQCAPLGDNWITLQTCQTGCQDNKCAGESPSFMVLISDWGWLIIIIVSVVIAGAGVAVMELRKRKKEKPFTI